MVRNTWLRRTVSYGVTAMMACFGLTGIVSAQTITNTGPYSTNVITNTNTDNCRITNTNRVSANNSNSQTATTGGATVSDNTSAGASWAGWSTLDPLNAQAAGQSYASWWSEVVGWIGQHASGAGWNSTESNLSWVPGSNNWSGFDPMTWQANGQSFANWYNATQSFLNSNSSNWVLSWPADATGTVGLGGAVSGNASNNFNANFSININNAARAAAGTNGCGQSNFTPPPVSGGSGGSSGSVLGSSSFVPRNTHRTGGGGGGVLGGAFFVPQSGHFSAPVAHTVASTPIVSSPATPPAGGSGGTTTPPAPQNTIANTGPFSTNTITNTNTNNSTVSNYNNVSVSNYSTQTASTGNATVSDNTSTGGAGSGAATNTGGDGTGVNVTN